MTSENRGSIASKSHDSVDSDDMDTWDCIIDHEDDIDWDNIIATTEDDFQAGRYAFNSADYAGVRLRRLAFRSERILQLARERLQEKRLIRHHPRLNASLAQRF